MMLETSPRTTIRKKTIAGRGKRSTMPTIADFQPVVEPVDEEPDKQDDLDDPDRDPENSRDLQGRKERLFDDRRGSSR